MRFSPEVLAVLVKSVQRGAASKERVGQLYARDLTIDTVEIVKATQLTPRWASFAKVKFDPKVAMAERIEMFDEGLHCVGLWHTHPEPKPTPSPEDRQLAKDYALAAKPQLAGIVFAIVGTSPFPLGLRVWVHDGRQLQIAEPLVANGHD
jgi:proteasome lid subunit RPN8/RPN11